MQYVYVHSDTAINKHIKHWGSDDEFRDEYKYFLEWLMYLENIRICFRQFVVVCVFVA